MEPPVSSVFPLPPLAYYAAADKDMTKLRTPPTPPREDEEYSCFGQVRKLREMTPSLTDLGRTQLFESQGRIDFEKEIPGLLKVAEEKLAAILIRFSEFHSSKQSITGDRTNYGIFVRECTNLASELENVYANLLYLVNEYRPHQARELLIEIKKQQIEARRSMTKKLKDLVQAAQKEIDDELLALSVSSQVSQTTSTTNDGMMETEEDLNESTKVTSVSEYLATLVTM